MLFAKERPDKTDKVKLKVSYLRVWKMQMHRLIRRRPKRQS